MSDQMGGYNPPGGYQPQGGYPQQGGYGSPQGGYPQQQGGWGQVPGYGPQQGWGQQQPGYGGVQQQSRGGLRLDLESIKPGGLIAIASGLLLFIVGFFHWWVPNVDKSCQFFPPGREQTTCRSMVSGTGASAWDRGITTFALILALLIVALFVVKALHLLPAVIPAELVAAGLLVLADIFFLVTFLSKHIKGVDAGLVSRGWALYLGLLLVLGLNAGVILALLNSGGLDTIRGSVAKLQSQQRGTGYGQQQWSQPPPPQQQWGQPVPPQWGQPAPGAQPGGWPTGPATGGQPYPTGPQPQAGPQTGSQPAQPGWGQPEQQPYQGGWPQQEPGWGQPRHDEQPPQPGWGQQRPEEQPPHQGGWPPQPPQQGGWPQ